jgi:hypothetical protein
VVKDKAGNDKKGNYPRYNPNGNPYPAISSFFDLHQHNVQ